MRDIDLRYVYRVRAVCRKILPSPGLFELFGCQKWVTASGNVQGLNDDVLH